MSAPSPRGHDRFVHPTLALWQPPPELTRELLRKTVEGIRQVIFDTLPPRNGGRTTAKLLFRHPVEQQRGYLFQDGDIGFLALYGCIVWAGPGVQTSTEDLWRSLRTLLLSWDRKSGADPQVANDCWFQWEEHTGLTVYFDRNERPNPQ